MASKDDIINEVESLYQSVEKNIREIEIAIKSNGENPEEQLNNHLNRLKKVRFKLRAGLDGLEKNPSAEIDKIEDKEIWELISEARKLLDEQKKIIKNR
jgi:hypothetical protein